MENKVVAGQLVIVNKILKKLPQVRQVHEDSSPKDFAYNGVILQITEDIKYIRRKLKRQL